MSRFGKHEQQKPVDEGSLADNVVKIYRCSKVVRGGRRFSFSALVVVGDRQGRVGVGYGKAKEVPTAVEKGKKMATRNLTEVQLAGATLPHRVMGRFGASKVVLVPAQKGTGVIAGASVRAVLELAGVKDVLTKSYGSSCPKNLVRATFAALTRILTAEKVAELRGVPVG
jgi:small subunit ribosomal protein S5